MRRNHLHWPRLIALTAALAALLLVATGATVWHDDAPGSPCSICYAAHLPALQTLPVRTPVASELVSRLVPNDLRRSHATPDLVSSAPRAPPA